MVKCKVCGSEYRLFSGKYVRGATKEIVCRECLKKAKQLLISAQYDFDFANEELSCEQYLFWYDNGLDKLRQLSEIADVIKLRGISGNPKQDYQRLLEEKQWHLRDAIERIYNNIVKEGTTTYRNNIKQVKLNCSKFMKDLENCSKQFDEETMEFSKNLLEKLSQTFNIEIKTSTQYKFVLANADEMLVKAIEIVLDTRNTTTAHLQRKLKISYLRANLIIEQMEEIGIVSSPNENFVRDVLVTQEVAEDMLFCGIEIVSENMSENNITLEKTDNCTGLEFEKIAKEILLNNKYENVIVTKSSGDQGADVIAYKDGVKYAIQCKKYTQAVGNSAVQEAIGSKSIYDCHVAVVMTNNYFTKSAKELAQKNLVLLWDREVLKQMINNNEE